MNSRTTHTARRAACAQPLWLTAGQLQNPVRMSIIFFCTVAYQGQHVLRRPAYLGTTVQTGRPLHRRPGLRSTAAPLSGFSTLLPLCAHALTVRPTATMNSGRITAPT
ncbi:hypothetical protein TREES_T100014874 [Tupaia chinensis]|uniref:Uncharacterized protein n=1 Tax=Tupaia chinensis TaxID=246437 RepID=L9KUA0_TUPCH|nr:hypothetical protein TREES_T100014874 [Tupaia chinensis]